MTETWIRNGINPIMFHAASLHLLTLIRPEREENLFLSHLLSK